MTTIWMYAADKSKTIESGTVKCYDKNSLKLKCDSEKHEANARMGGKYA